jgi:hypothetical protein
MGNWSGFSTRPMPGVYPLPESIIASDYMRGYEWDEATRYRTRAVQQNPEYWGLWIRLPKRGNYLEYEMVCVLARPLLFCGTVRLLSWS